MSKKLLIIQNIEREGPGILGRLLNTRKIDYTLLLPDEVQDFNDLMNYEALVVLGGPDSANDDSPRIKCELNLIEQALSLEMPYLGICLGMQLLVKAAGGAVFPASQREIGFFHSDGSRYTVELTQAGSDDPLLAQLQNPFSVFHLHGETVELPANASLLGKGEICKNQIVKVGKSAYGIQCHFELTKDMLQSWLERDPWLMECDRVELEEQFAAMEVEYTETGENLFSNFLTLV